MVNRVPDKSGVNIPRAKSIRADLSDEGWHSLGPRDVEQLDVNHALSLWAGMMALCAAALAAFVLFDGHDSHAAVAVLLSAAGLIALVLSAGKISGKSGWPL
jgi:hypothetical protein